ncbi:MAG: 30S ribosomal protein S20 [Chlamydiia bacterium]
MAQADQDIKKVRRPQAQKRALQAEKANLRNRVFKSQVRSALRHLDDAVKAGEATAVKEQVALVYSLADKGTKRGVYKVNKAARLKAGVARLLQSTAS